MGSTNSRRAGVVAALAAALVMMGGAAFASPPSGTTDYNKPVNPGAVTGGAYAVVVTTIADATHLM